MEIFERLNCVIIDGKSYVKASDAKLMYDEIERLRGALKDMSCCCEGKCYYKYDICAHKMAANALKEKE